MLNYCWRVLWRYEQKKTTHRWDGLRAGLMVAVLQLLELKLTIRMWCRGYTWASSVETCRDLIEDYLVQTQRSLDWELRKNGINPDED